MLLSIGISVGIVTYRYGGYIYKLYNRYLPTIKKYENDNINANI